MLEHRVNPLVNDYGDALWWAFMDVTTVGSNIIAQTVTGRVLSVLLAALGYDDVSYLYGLYYKSDSTIQQA